MLDPSGIRVQKSPDSTSNADGNMNIETLLTLSIPLFASQLVAGR
jgi:hypothetical protein